MRVDYDESMKAHTGFLSMVFLVFVTLDHADGDSYRCGRKVVRDGDPVSHLLRVCGEPRFKASGSAMIKVDGARKKTRVQRWHYKQGRRSLERIILIYKGEIAAIEVGGR